MRSIRPLVLALGLMGIAAPLALVPEPVHAQSPAAFAAPGLVEIVPANDVIGDGASPVTLHVVALAPDGKPLEGLRLKPSATLGTVEGWSEVGAGVYAFTYTAEAVTAPTSALIEVKGRTASRAAINASYKLPVRPPAATGMTIIANPPRIVLGQDGEGSISFVLENAAGNANASDIAVRTSVGELQNLTHLGDGRFTARFIAPKVNYPQLAVITATDLRDPDRVHGRVALPLQGKTDYPVQATAGSSVVLRIGGREYGPVQATATGRAAVPVVVPPGVQSATKVEVREGQTVEEELDLRVPETRRISMLPLPRAVPADGTTAVPVRVAVFTPDGRPDTTARVAFTTTGGSVGEATHLGEGIYQALLTPRFSNTAQTAELTASITGSSVQVDTIDLRMVPARPQTVTLRAQPERLNKDATALRLFAKVLGANGQGLDSRELALTVAGATVKDGVQDLRNGDYRVDFSATANANVDVVATVRNPPTGNPLQHVLLFPQTDVAPNDGAATTRISVVTVDAWGFPVPNTDVQLKIETGDGQVQPSVRTNDSGIGQVFYSSGTGAGMVRIRARAGNRTGAVALIQGPPAVAGASVPPAGTAEAIALTQAWEGLVVPLRIPRDGATEGAVGPQDAASSKVGVLSRIELRTEPSTAAPGGRLTLMIDAKDVQGLGVGGLPIELLVSQGQAGAVTDLGGGRYQAVVTLPPTAAGELKVSVASGDYATFSKVPISGAVAQGGWGEGQAGGAQVPAVDPATNTGGSPGTAPDMTGYRVRGAFVTSGLTYTQRPLPANGPLIDAIFAVGGEQGGKPGYPQGFEGAVRGFPHEYVGFEADARFTFWSFTADIFDGETVNDQIVALNADAIGRYPFVVGDDHFWVGARAGYHGSDIVYLTGDVDGVMQFQSLYVQGMDFGAEIGAEIDDLYIHGNLGGQLVGVSRWFGTAVDAHVGYHVTEEVFIDAGFGLRERQVTVLGDTSGNELGELADRQVMGRFGVGYAF